MTRSCYHSTRGYCFCEFCIASHLKNAYVQANNSPKQPIDFRNIKKAIQLSPLEIYCKQFNNVSPTEPIYNSKQGAFSKTPLNSPNSQTNKKIDFDIDDNQTKFLRILSDRLTQLAEQQAQYIISNSGQSKIFKESIINSSLLQRRAKLLSKLNIRPIRLRSSISESSGYETNETLNNSPLPCSTTHCESAGMLFNTTGSSIIRTKTREKNSSKFGPEDILSTTNPMFLFDSNQADEPELLKKSSRRRRKSGLKKEQLLLNDSNDSNNLNSPNHSNHANNTNNTNNTNSNNTKNLKNSNKSINSQPDIPKSLDVNKKYKNVKDKDSRVNKAKKSTINSLSNVTNTLVKKIVSIKPDT